jgi:hypothetical protein
MKASSSSIRFLLFIVSIVFYSSEAGTSPEGLKFLAKKKLEEGIVARPSGLL